MGSVNVSSCRCCMFVSCVHPVAVLNAAFDLQFVNAGRGCNRRPYRRGILQSRLITALYVAMSVSFCGDLNTINSVFESLIFN